MDSSPRRSLAEKAVRGFGLLLCFAGKEQSFAFVTVAQRHASLTCNQRGTAQSATATVVRRPCSQYPDSTQRLMECFQRRKHQAQGSRTRTVTVLGSVQDEFVTAEGVGGKGQTTYNEGDMGMAPVNMEQAMGSFSPEWDNTTARVDPKESLIKGSVIAANQTAFPFSIDSFPPLSNSEVYYNGTSEKFWWNQNAEAVCVYVPVPVGFDQNNVEFVAKTRHISLSLDGKEVLTGTPFYRLNGYESLFVVDLENDPPYVQLELYKVREFQNWEDLLLESSAFTPGGAQ